MPPEPLPWERFKDRRYDRPQPPDGLAGPWPRWRDPPPPPPPHNGFRGRVPGNGRPGPWRYHSTESGRGFASSRANEKFNGDEGFRPSGYRMDGRYNNRFSRDNNKGPFGHRDNMRGHNSWENDLSPNSSGRPYFGNDHRSDDERGSFVPKDLRNNCWENGRVQNGNDQRSVDEKGAFGRREMRGKFGEIGSGQCSVDDKAPFEKKDLKRRFSPENGSLPNSFNVKRPVDDKGSFGQKNLRGKSCENAPSQSSMNDKDMKEHLMENGVVPNSTDRVQNGNDIQTFTSPTYSELSKDECDKFSGANDVVIGQKLEKENSLASIDWKPLKWSRSGSLCSRGSYMKSPDSAEQKTEMPPYSATPLRSPSGDVCATSAFSSEEGSERKKPRLGWGEGLAKFEKKKVEGPDDDSATKPGLAVCVGGEPSLSNLADKSPTVAGLLECVSPATPSSVACFSPGGEDKQRVRSANIDCDANYSSGSPTLPHQEQTEANLESEFCLENVKNISVANITSSLTELVHLDDSTTVDSNFVKSTAMNKLLVWRGEALKALEATESEIDSLENDLKKLIPSHENSQAEACEDVEKDLEIQKSEFVEPLREVKGNMCADVVENLEICPIYVSNDEGSCHLIASLTCEKTEALCDRILASNKDTVIKAYEEFNKLLPANDYSINALRTSSVSKWKENTWIMEKFMFKKRCKKFEERVNSVKYRALQQLWKEDLQLTSLKKNNPRSHKRSEITSRGLNGSKKKLRSVRSRFSNAAGNSSLAPTAGAINFTRKLLSDSQIKPYRNSLKMPALITDKKEKMTTRFISNNGLVEDPCAMEKERKMINPWTKEETDIFLDKFATIGKDFNKISFFLDHKTTADCVEFYYKNHKSDCFLKLKKKPDFAKQGKSYSFNNYLVGSGKRWDSERNAASLDVLGEASEIAANADNATKNRQENSNSKPPKIDDFDVSVNERETEAAGVLAGICGSISSEAMGSCITSSFDRGENYENTLLTNQNEESYSDDSCGEIEIEANNWTDEEKSLLVEAVASYGNDFVMISRRVGTKTREQCKVFFSKARKCLGLDVVRPMVCDGRRDDNNGGGSDDTNGACVLEANSEISSEKSSSKMEKDVILFDVDMIDVQNNECNEPDESEKVIIDGLTKEVKPEIDLDGDVERENSVENGTLLHDIEEVGGKEEALSPVGSVLADDVARAEEQEMVSEKNSNNDDETVKKLNEEPDICVQDLNHVQGMVSKNTSVEYGDEKKLNEKHDETGTYVQDLNHAQELNCETPSKVEFVVDIKQEKKMPIALNPPLEPLDIALGGNTCHVNKTAMPAGVLSSPRYSYEMIAEKLYKKCTSADNSVFVGYPLQVAVNRERNGDYTPSTPSSGPEFPFYSHEQKKSHFRHNSWSSSSDNEKPKSNGDVKLFGQILKSQPKENTSEKINQKHSGANIVESDLGKFDRNNYLCLENVPTKSYGFWEGNRVQTGFVPPLPDSAILLAKYPSAFGNFSSTSNVENLQNLQSVVKNSSNDLNLNGVSVFPSSGNGLVDYQLYRNNQQDFISEMQRRNGNGVFANMRNPIGVIGTNVGISDPVAAIKMHYAKVEKYSNNVATEEESWRGKADLGR